MSDIMREFEKGFGRCHGKAWDAVKAWLPGAVAKDKISMLEGLLKESNEVFLDDINKMRAVDNGIIQAEIDRLKTEIKDKK